MTFTITKETRVIDLIREARDVFSEYIELVEKGELEGPNWNVCLSRMNFILANLHKL